MEVEFDRERARALDASVGTASTAVRAAFGGYTATEFTGPNGLKDVQVIYPQRDLRSLAGIESIPIRANNGSIVTVGDITNLVDVAGAPADDAHQPAQRRPHRRERRAGRRAFKRHAIVRAAAARAAISPRA